MIKYTSPAGHTVKMFIYSRRRKCRQRLPRDEGDIICIGYSPEGPLMRLLLRRTFPRLNLFLLFLGTGLSSCCCCKIMMLSSRPRRSISRSASSCSRCRSTRAWTCCSMVCLISSSSRVLSSCSNIWNFFSRFNKTFFTSELHC